MKIKNMVRELIESNQTNNPFEICNNLGIYVSFSQLTEEVNGFFNCNNNLKIIIINNMLTCSKKKLVCAHELGHALMHADVNAFYLSRNTFLKTSVYEWEADIFASELLYCDDDFMEYKHLTIKQISVIFDLSEKVTEYRLKECNKY